MKKKKTDELDFRIIRICERLKEIREARGYKSYEHFAYEHNIGRMSYWRIERKEGSNLTLSTLLKYLDIHNMTLEEFFLYDLDKSIKENGSINQNN